jgi:two-component system CitB family sensor kinase
MFPAILRPRRRGEGRRLSTRILVSQLVILAVTSIVGFTLFAWAQRAQLDTEYEHRALAIAQVAASDPVIVESMEHGGGGTRIQTAAQRIARSADASYVVVIDRNHVRHSHPDPALIGQPVTEPLVVLDNTGHTGIDVGATGRSANGKAPLFNSAGAVIGEVSVGMPESNVAGALWTELPTFGLYAGLALAIGAAVSYLLARRLKRITFGLELEEISGLLQDREAMLHGIREGVLAFDPGGRVTVCNDEARRLLGLGTVLGSRLADLLPDGRLRRVLDGSLTGVDLTVLTDSHCLAVNRMPVTLHGQELGAVVTVRDRTELVGLLRELDSVRGLTDALRSQQHEFSNRMHTLAGLLDLGEYEAAHEYVVECAGAEPALAESVRERIGNSLMVGLIVAKTTVAAERGVHLVLAEDSWLDENPGHLRRLLTIVGNLLDNAVDAAASDRQRPAEVRLSLVETAAEVTVQVSDSGPGIPSDAIGRIFEDGWSTRTGRGTARRGLGLALVHRLVQRHRGTIEVAPGPGAVFTVVLPLPDAALPDHGWGSEGYPPGDWESMVPALSYGTGVPEGRVPPATSVGARGRGEEA